RALKPTGRGVTVVGDDAQSIYAFRGADIRNILDFSKDFPDCRTFRLEQNYRSSKYILQTADTLIRHNREQIPKHLWTDNPAGEPVLHWMCIDDKEEGHQIVRGIQEEIRHQGRDLKDFAVFYRTNAQSRSIEDALRRMGIPYVIVGGIRFYDRREIKDVLAYLRILVNPRDDESVRRVINVPARGIGEMSLARLLEYASRRGIGLVEALGQLDRIDDLPERAKKNMLQFRNLVGKFTDLQRQISMSELSRALVDELGILRAYKEEGTQEALGRWDNIQELLSAISEFEDSRETPTLDEFLEEVSLVSDIDRWEDSRNAVTLMTLHASKGLEFPVVFIVGLEEGLLPFSQGILGNEELEEERRLLYVGITRARSKLILTQTRMRYRFGDLTYPLMSRFLPELGSETVVSVDIGGGAQVRETGTARRRHRGAPSRESRPASEAAYFSDAFPDYESESQEPVEIRRGTIVMHEMFGRGKVLSISGTGESRKASVQFEEFGLKNLVLKFARLRPG
ncbi:MAG: 3'-5' exonuclease, partial [Bacteroidota bacterium]